ncbi:MAG: site-specific integrase [Deltaproteobacteria bacterium]|nr:site-specific integrase [Deltaproteobacteria bacterium]
MARRFPTKYPGVYYRMSRRLGGPGEERIYYIIYKKDGKTHEEKVGRQFVDDLTEAKVARIRGERVEGKRQSRKEVRETAQVKQKEQENRWTLDRIWAEYKRQKSLKGIAQDESRYKNYIHPLFGEKEPVELIPLDVDRLRINLAKERSPQTVKLTLALLRRIANFGAKKRISKPLSFPIELPVVDNLTTEDLTADQLARLLQAIEDDHNVQGKNFMKLILYTGMRRGELFNLKWQDIDFERGFIWIHNPKGGKTVSIPLSSAAGDLLSNHPRSDSEYVFPGRGGNKRTEIRRPIDRIRERAGLPEGFRPLHGLRHLFGSMLVSSGIDIYTVQRLLTHKNANTTLRYAHLRDQAMRDGSDKAAEIIDRAKKDSDKKKVVRLNSKREADSTHGA